MTVMSGVAELEAALAPDWIPEGAGWVSFTAARKHLSLSHAGGAGRALKAGR